MWLFVKPSAERIIIANFLKNVLVFNSLSQKGWA